MTTVTTLCLPCASDLQKAETESFIRFRERWISELDEQILMLGDSDWELDTPDSAKLFMAVFAPGWTPRKQRENLRNKLLVELGRPKMPTTYPRSVPILKTSAANVHRAARSLLRTPVAGDLFFAEMDKYEPELRKMAEEVPA